MAIEHKSISFVIPCLNEKQTLPFILDKINKTRFTDLREYESEVILSDNGSTDGSIAIARSFGAKVVECQERGYGAALKYGISQANNEIIIFADADDTYDFGESPILVNELEKGFDLVLGSRLKGKVFPGAMPFLHRYLGTPALNSMINTLYGKKSYKTSDCNSGFRCFLKKEFLNWEVTSNGMEFASEMLVKAMKSNSLIAEVPVSLHPDHPGRKPHLKTWRDGMMHLLRIFVDSPSFFNTVGTSLFMLSFAILLISLATPLYVHIFGLSIFGIHTMMFSVMGTVLGQLIWSSGLFISVKNGGTNGVYSKIIGMSEDVLVWIIAVFVLFIIITMGVIVVYWAILGFENLDIQKQTLFATAICVNGMIFTTNVFSAHLLKRT